MLRQSAHTITPRLMECGGSRLNWGRGTRRGATASSLWDGPPSEEVGAGVRSLVTTATQYLNSERRVPLSEHFFFFCVFLFFLRHQCLSDSIKDPKKLSLCLNNSRKQSNIDSRSTSSPALDGFGYTWAVSGGCSAFVFPSEPWREENTVIQSKAAV